jgi:hypothetical protein
MKNYALEYLIKERDRLMNKNYVKHWGNELNDVSKADNPEYDRECIKSLENAICLIKIDSLKKAIERIRKEIY